MSYANLMVHVGADRLSDARIRLAAGLADRLHAGLIGIAGFGPRPPFVAEGVVIDVGPTEEEMQAMAAELAKLGERFRAAAGVDRPVEWRTGLDYPIDVVLREARAADLIVVGRERGAPDIFRSLDAATVILRVGRPVLVPTNGLTELEPRRVMVAWKDTREARRALRDALPLLAAAEKVFVAEACEQGDEDDAPKRLADVTQYLARHRISGATSIVLHTRNAGKELLRVVEEERIDVVVAGAYGHSRLGEWAFGGVTRELLASQVCCLFSH
jgi:nucleotide-binding universal stress UspA family protein